MRPGRRGLRIGGRNPGNRHRLAGATGELRVDEFIQDEAAVLLAAFDDIENQDADIRSSIGATGARRPASE
jgi:hypothetical protein